MDKKYRARKLFVASFDDTCFHPGNMPTLAPFKKTVLEVVPGIQAKVKSATPPGMSSKKFTSILLEFALGKLAAREIILSEPEIKEYTASEGGSGA